nr:hypothetical protein [Croceibacterium ferulae]
MVGYGGKITSFSYKQIQLPIFTALGFPRTERTVVTANCVDNFFTHQRRAPISYEVTVEKLWQNVSRVRRIAGARGYYTSFVDYRAPTVNQARLRAGSIQSAQLALEFSWTPQIVGVDWSY